MRLRHSLSIAATFAALLALVSGCTKSASRTSRPDIVLIIADDLGPGDLGCYGQKIIRTPNIDALARRGVRFTSAYSGAPVCAPSRCTLLTGKSTAHSAIRDNLEINPTGQQPLPKNEPTLSSVLHRAGYRTACIGKWGLGVPGSEGDPANHGFDLFFGYYCQRHAHNHAPTHLFRNATRVELDGNLPKPLRGDADLANYAPDLMKQEAIGFIESGVKRPFFLMFATTVPHLALQVPPDSLAEYEGQVEDTPYDGRQGYLPHRAPHAAYAAMITRLDRDIGEIMDALRRTGKLESTLIVLTSDNGPTYTGGADSAFFNSAESRRGLKGQLYEGGIRVPLIVSLPNQVRADRTDSSPCANYDLLPTICDLAQVDPPRQLDGVSMWPMLFERTRMPERTLYWETPSGSASQAARIGDFKAVRTRIRSGQPVLEIFDLKQDPFETRDLSKLRPDLAERFNVVFRSRMKSNEAQWNFPAP